MSKKEKLFERLKNNPKDARFSDIENLLYDEGFTMTRVTGSHHIFKKQEIIFVILVHNKRVKSVYVKRVIELIESANQKRPDENSISDSDISS
jgi:predicted RNA binding protein YcfA (HicA-like mRNA interferase family)